MLNFQFEWHCKEGLKSKNNYAVVNANEIWGLQIYSTILNIVSSICKVQSQD